MLCAINHKFFLNIKIYFSLYKNLVLESSFSLLQKILDNAIIYFEHILED
jgi:hypothetical protein